MTKPPRATEYRTRIDRAQYDLLVESYRRHPGVVEKARKHAGVGYLTAKRAWNRGWPRPDWAISIKELFRREQEAARAVAMRDEAEKAKAAAALRAERELSRLDAAAERAREAEGVRAALSSALSLMANLGAFSGASIALSRKAAQGVLEAVATGTVSWRDAIALLTKLAWVGSQATSQLKTAMEAMRLHLGEPSEILGVVHSGQPTLLLDGEAALASFGEERLRAAIIDLAHGTITDDARRLLEWQVEQSERAN